MKVTSVLADPSYAILKQFVLEHTGLQYYAEKDEDLAARLARRMTILGVRDCTEYLRRLQADFSGRGEWDALIGQVTIGETYFFRQSEHFDLLQRTIIPELIARKQDTRRLRIWSAGCATGAEPYSLSLLLQLNFAEQFKDWDVSILATDINTEFLAQARTGRFGEWALRQMPDSLRQCCFRREGKSWELMPEYRQNVRFEHHNLASSEPYPGSTGAPIDIIVCRNVMIYFSGDRIRSVAQRFFESLDDGGWLLVGHAEPSANNFPQFEVVSAAETTAYRKPVRGEADGIRQHNVSPWSAVLEDWLNDPPPPARYTEKLPATRPLSFQSLTREVSDRSVLISDLEQARTWADVGNWAAAERVCRELIERDPLCAATHFTLALVLAHTTGGEGVQSSLRRAIYLEREFALAHYHLGLSLQASRDVAQSRKTFQNVVDLLLAAPDDDVVPHGDGIRVGELRDLAMMHLELSNRP